MEHDRAPALLCQITENWCGRPLVDRETRRTCPIPHYALTVCPHKGRDLIAFDDALTALAAVDARKSEGVELRFFGGLSVAETAEALHISPETVVCDWNVAKVWLRELDGGASHVV